MADKPNTDGAPAPTPEQEVRRLYEEAESRVAKATERVVSRDSFGELLAMVTENAVAVTRIGNEAMDLVLRNLRVASRQDINRLTRALGRTEDKLEQVLQEVERLRDELDADASSNGTSSRAQRQQQQQPEQRRRHDPPAHDPTLLVVMTPFERLARTPIAALEFANTLLTVRDAEIGTTPREAVWTHRNTTLWRYRSTNRQYPVPVLLVFALINRPTSSTCAPATRSSSSCSRRATTSSSSTGACPDESDSDQGLDFYVCDEIPSGDPRDAAGERPGRGQHARLVHRRDALAHALRARPRHAVRNLLLLTTPVDTSGSLYFNWTARDSFDVDHVADVYGSVPGRQIDWANKLMKPVTNYWTTYRRLWQQIYEGDGAFKPDAYQAMAKWVADNPPFPGQAYREWITFMYKENRLVRDRMRMRGKRVDLATSTRTSWSSPPAPTTSRRARARSRCSTWSAARTSRTSTGPAGTSASWPARGRARRSGPTSPSGSASARTAREGEEGKESTWQPPRRARRSHGSATSSRADRARHRRHARHRRRDLPRARRTGREHRRRLQPRRRGGRAPDHGPVRGERRHVTHQGNIGIPDDCRRTIKEVLDRHGRLDILVNNAGITSDKTVFKMSDEDWQKVLDVNLSGAFFLSKAALEHMVERGTGRIINISSIIGQTGNIGQSNYAASKSGLFGLTMTFAKEAAYALNKADKLEGNDVAITVNAIAPGFIETDMLSTVPEKVLDGIRAQVPLRRLGHPDEVARAAYFLAGDESGYINGQVIAVNGGMDM